jgi:hypothetical protein
MVIPVFGFSGGLLFTAAWAVFVPFFNKGCKGSKFLVMSYKLRVENFKGF